MYIRIIDGEYQDHPLLKIDDKKFYDENGWVNAEEFNLATIELLDLLCDEKDKIIFTFNEHDRDLDLDKEYMSQQWLESFHRDSIYDKNGRINEAVKKTLVGYYRDLDSNIKEEDGERLLLEFRNSSLENIDSLLIEKLKEVLYRKLELYRLSDLEEHHQEFLNKRIYHIDTNWEFPYNEYLVYEKPESYIRTLWIDVTASEDRLFWCKDRFCAYTGVILDKTSIEEFKYYVTIAYEEWEMGEEIVIRILEREKGSFENKVFPRLEGMFDLVEKIDYEEQ